ncbi:hypothetical protein Y032_0063g3427 [Ancylostoma ceylanicum]|uniref:Uncharacterized protein n=1 Tax=Ancylostoma ceylanicum TaxID=53326 RepID=A0A016U1C4_9BILA|nr:hypothetical protein Y032_0063g3427 [Ancylostoma ceylanicum]
MMLARVLDGASATAAFTSMEKSRLHAAKTCGGCVLPYGAALRDTEVGMACTILGLFACVSVSTFACVWCGTMLIKFTCMSVSVCVRARRGKVRFERASYRYRLVTILRAQRFRTPSLILPQASPVSLCCKISQLIMMLLVGDKPFGKRR